MAIADMIPTMADAELESLKANATRLEATATGAQQKAAAALLPLIEAEQADRAARAPAKPVRGRKPKAATTKAASKKAAKADEEPAEDSEEETAEELV